MWKVVVVAAPLLLVVLIGRGEGLGEGEAACHDMTSEACSPAPAAARPNKATSAAAGKAARDNDRGLLRILKARGDYPTLSLEPVPGSHERLDRPAARPSRVEPVVGVHSRPTFDLLLAGPGLPLALDHCTDRQPFANEPRTFRFAVPSSDVESADGGPENSLPAGTVISFTTSNGRILGDTSFSVPAAGRTRGSAPAYSVTVQSDASQSDAGACDDRAGRGQLTARVETPLGSVTNEMFPITD